jgi:NAD(P)-dependent dehydrogenase (short-subunit alcohol dehydrogenase family)
VLALPLDVTDRDAVLKTVAQAHRHFGRLDVILSNAEYGFTGAIEAAAVDDVRQNFETNVFETLSVVRQRCRCGATGRQRIRAVPLDQQ